MEVKSTGLLKRLEAKATLGLPVEASDVVELAKILNRNADKLAGLSNRLDEVISSVTKGFLCIDGTLEALNDTNDDQELINKSLADDLDGVYEDMNGHLGGETDDHVLVRRSELVDEEESVDGVIHTASEEGTPMILCPMGDVTLTYDGKPIIATFHGLSL